MTTSYQQVSSVFEVHRDRIRIRAEIPADIHRDDDALGPERFRPLRDQGRVVDGARVHAHFVGPGPQDLLDIVERAYASPDGQRKEELVCCTLDQVDNDTPFLFRCGDIEKDNLICTLLVVPLGEFHRVTGIPEAEKIGPFHYPALLEIEAGDDPSRQHHWIKIWRAIPIYIS